jgi:hypothetical protein
MYLLTVWGRLTFHLKLTKHGVGHVCLKFIEDACTRTFHYISLSHSGMASIPRNCQFCLQEIRIGHEAECWLAIRMHLLERRTSRKIYFMILSWLHEFVTWEFRSVRQLLVFSSWSGCLSSRSVYGTGLMLPWSRPVSSLQWRSSVRRLSGVLGQSPIRRGPLKGPQSSGCSRWCWGPSSSLFFQQRDREVGVGSQITVS